MAYLKKGRYGSSQKGDGWATPEYYGAKGNVGVNDLTAFTTALSDLSVTGGRLILGPKTYRLDNLITVPNNVSIEGVPDVTYLASNHASANGLVFVDYNEGPPVVVSDVRFIGLVANTGTCIVNNSGARVQFKRCSWNGFVLGAPSSNLQGKIASVNAADSRVEFVDCDLNVVGNVRGVDVTTGYARLVRGSLVMPQSYSQSLLYANSGADAEMNGVSVNCSAHTAGTAYIFTAIGRGRMIGNKVNGQVGVSTTGFWWEEGAQVVSKDNIWDMNNFFNPNGPNVAGVGSQIELLPTLAINAGAVTVVNSSVYGARAYTSLLVRNASTSPTTISLPQGVVPGQVLHFTYLNAAVSALTVSFTGMSITASALPGSGTLGAGNTLSSTFVWENAYVGASFSYRWVQKGAWSVGLALVA